MKRLALTFVLIICAFTLSGEWSTDPAVNTLISGITGEQVLPKIGVCQNGDYYISWYSNDSGNYDVRLQRLDYQGNFLWEDNGILVSDNPAMSWLTDWDMIVDNNDNAIIAFQDIRTGINNIFVYKIDSDGEFIWGEDGIQLSDTDVMDVAPKICVTSENNVVIAWAADSIIRVNKINSDGSLPWGDQGFEISGENTFSWPQLLAVENDNFIMKYFEDSGPYWAPDRFVYAQKYDADGTSVWDTSTTIVDEGGITAWNQIFSMVKDDQNGFYIAWHEDRYGTMDAHVFAQHIGADGSVMFQDDGVELALQGNRERFNPEIVWDQNSEDIFVYWTEMDSDQNSAGVYGQRLNSIGETIWGDDGLQIVPIQQPRYTLISAESAPLGALLFMEQGDGNSNISAALMDENGLFAWENEIVDISSVASAKLHIESVTFANDQWIITWEDERNDSGDLYAQNVSTLGELGPVASLSGISGTVSLDGGEGIITDVTVSAGTISTNPDSDGIYFLELEPGTYNVSAELENYETAIVENIIVETGMINDDNNLTLVYIEPQLNPPTNVAIDPITAILTWDAPAVRLLTGYQIMLDNDVITTLDTDDYSYQYDGLVNGQTYNAGICAIYDEGNSDTLSILFEYSGTAVEDAVPTKNILLQNYPNPFNPNTHIGFQVSETCPVLIEIYNTRGEKIKTLVNKLLTPNLYDFTWNGTNDYNQSVSSGIYFYKMKAGRYTSTRKMILMK